MPSKNVSFLFDDSNIGAVLSFINDKIYIVTNNNFPIPYPDGWRGDFFDQNGNPATESQLFAVAESLEEFVELFRNLAGSGFNETNRPIPTGMTFISTSPLKIIKYEFHLPSVTVISTFLPSPLPDGWLTITQGAQELRIAIGSDIEEWLKLVMDNPF